MAGQIPPKSQIQAAHAPQSFKAIYNIRNRIEDAFSSMKRLFGGCLRSRTLAAQKTEIACMVVCHNIRILYKQG